jgi:D-sedoheptulose 7-phosphate isomerase
MTTRIRAYLDESLAVYTAIRADPALTGAIARAADACVAALRDGGKVMFCGNGGSAADAQHLAGELVSRFMYDRPGLAAVALTTDSSILTAIGNDYGYEQVFSRQVEALARSGDVLVGISTSGRSPNVLRALQAARARGVATIGFTGRDGGPMAALCDIELRMPSDVTPLIQQGHLLVGHLLCLLVEESLHPNSA